MFRGRACGRVAGRVGQHGIFGQGFDALSASGLPVPRYVSLKSDHVNVRAGPTKDNDVAWVYTRSGLPVEITAEFENWRRVRDSEGAEGWVYHSLLSGRRTAVVTMKTKDELAPLYDRADPTSAVAARLQAGVVAQVKHCAAGWCRVMRQRLRRLDRAAAAVGRLRRREGGLNVMSGTPDWIALVDCRT